jgi:hypothetical protein
MIWDWRECQPCEDAVSHVMRWKGPYSEDCYPDDFYDWAHEAMRHTPADECLFLTETADMWRHYLEDLADSAAACAAADSTRPWGDEGWAAFTWRMQTSPAFTPTN